MEAINLFVARAWVRGARNVYVQEVNDEVKSYVFEQREDQMICYDSDKLHK